MIEAKQSEGSIAETLAELLARAESDGPQIFQHGHKRFEIRFLGEERNEKAVGFLAKGGPLVDGL